MILNLGWQDTIAAIATGPATGGIGIVRISGESALSIVDRIFTNGSRAAAGNWQSHTLRYGHIVGEHGVIDEVMVSVMLAPKSYTKEDVVEINCHGGIKCLRAVLEEALKSGARMAEPGEFTKRAFLNGRIDLSEAEAVMELITAKTELSRQAAMTRLSGGLFEKIKAMRERVLTMLAHIEASIDYPEHDLEAMNLVQIKDESLVLAEEIKKLADSENRGKILKEGLNTVILGRPNVGKSMLLNAILGEERAIVTEIAGTTRDTIEEYANIGVPLKIMDTAGIRDTEDMIEKIGVGKSLESAEHAELILLVLDASAPLTEEDLRLLEFIKGRKAIVLLNKTDLEVRAGISLADVETLPISAKQKTGLDALYEKIRTLFFGGELSEDGTNEILISGIRQKEALLNAHQSLRDAVATIESGFSEDLAAIDLQSAYAYLGEITGESLDEDVIDKIFSEFCLGK